eukprot:4005258-Amphidinium_carterae.1
MGNNKMVNKCQKQLKASGRGRAILCSERLMADAATEEVPGIMEPNTASSISLPDPLLVGRGHRKRHAVASPIASPIH